MEKTMFPYGPPQEGMLENFNRLLPQAQRIIEDALGVINRVPSKERNEGEKRILEVLIKAKVFCILAIGPAHPPYDLDGVKTMLEIGMFLEGKQAAFPAPPSVKEKVDQAVEIWRAAIINFPMPRRWAPAVEWATRPALQELAELAKHTA